MASAGHGRNGGGGGTKSSKIDEFDEGTVVPLHTLHKSDNGKVTYKWGVPVYKGSDVVPCFDDGMLFRIIDEAHNNRWSFYNDTLGMQIRVTFVFGKRSKLKALENTTLEALDDGTFRASVTVYPLETELFVEGKVDGYTSDIIAESLSDDYLMDMARQDDGFVKQESATLHNLLEGNATIDQMVRACLQHKIKFVDFAFPPEQKSIQIGSLVKLRVLPWERPCMYLSDNYAKQARLFRNGVHPVNVDEGDLGNTWLTGAMAALAEYPDRVRDLFRHPESVEQGQQERNLGIYRVTLNKDGWWINVVVDDYLPVAGGRPKFARSKNDPCELWVSLLEKAYAKVYGGYGFVIAGDPLHALQNLSGFPCSNFDNALAMSAANPLFDLFGLLQTYVNNGYLILFTTPTHAMLSESRVASYVAESDVEAVYKKQKMPLGHTFAVLNMGVHEQRGAEPTRLVQLRNAWARDADDTWAGAWRKSDPRWDKNPTLARQFNFSKEDDGTFFMEWADVQAFFSGCGVCFLHHPIYDYRIRGTFLQDVPTTCLEVVVTEPTLMTIVLSQDDKRATTKSEHCPLMISIATGGGALTPMRVDLNSGFDNDHPTPEYTFLQSRDVSMFYEFRPEYSPYLVIPRSMSRYAQLPYVIGLLSPVEIGTPRSGVRVAFRALAPENCVFDNVPKFNYDSITAQTEYQARGIHQFFPDICVGTALLTNEEM